MKLGLTNDDHVRASNVAEPGSYIVIAPFTTRPKSIGLPSTGAHSSGRFATRVIQWAVSVVLLTVQKQEKCSRD